MMKTEWTSQPNLSYTNSDNGHVVLCDDQIVFESKSRCSSSDANNVITRVNLAFALGATRVVLQGWGSGMIEVYQGETFLGAY
jgi:hypothetical protein